MNRIPLRTVASLLVAGAAILGVVIGWLPMRPPQATPLDSLTPGSSTIAEPGGWDSGAVCAPKTLPPKYRTLEHVGSWTDGDGFTGACRTAWFRAERDILLLVAGYPTTPGNRLAIEVRATDGTLSEIVYAGHDPQSDWREWRVELPEGAAAVRVSGTDGLTGWGGWLGFSVPAVSSLALTWTPRMVLQMLGCCALSLLLLFGPGLVLKYWRQGDFTDVIWPGPLVLLLGGLIIWVLGGVVAPAVVAVVWVAVTSAATIILGFRNRIWTSWSRLEAIVLAMAACGVIGAAGKAAASWGPLGELYGGTVSRTLEIGGHSDSRISFHTVQLVGNHLAPHGPDSEAMFSPWGFARRGPAAGLIAAPIVLATAGKPPVSMPDQPWVPFDPQGFAAYRIAVMTLGALALVAVGGVLAQCAGDKAAGIGVGLLALSPFFWHELYFSWPKLIAAAWAIGAFDLVQRRSLALAGVAIAAAYLQHPMAMLSIPFLGLWILGGGNGAGPWHGRMRGATVFTLAFAAVIGGWQAANAGHVVQHEFLNYFKMAEGGGSNLETWLASRWRTLANTLVPLHVWLLHGDNPSFTALGFRSSRLVQFFLQYWTAAPFAVGSLTWLALLPAFFRAVASHARVALCVLIGPFLFLDIYWGAATTGLMREAGHVLFLSGWVFLAWTSRDKLPAWLWSPWFLGLRAIETLVMMHAPSLQAMSGTSWAQDWLINDLVSVGLCVLAVLATALFVSRLAPRAAQPSV